MQIPSDSSQYSHDLSFSWRNILLSGFSLWTLILMLTTLQVQHSCSPMLHWSNIPLPEYCSKSSSAEFIASKPSNLHVPPTPSSKPSAPFMPPPELMPPPAFTLPHSDGVAKTVGITAGVVAAILEAPLIVAVGAGALAWFIVKKTFG